MASAAILDPVSTGTGLISGTTGSSREIRVYKGIPYAAPPVGQLRWRAPQPVAPWEGVRKADHFGPVCPQTRANVGSSETQSPMSEDCLYLNVWTAAKSAREKRPVMVWLHGGGFVNGNGIEHDGYNGENLARFGDLVFCSINHRLGPLGYCDLAGVGGERFAASGNVGMLDIVAALEWIRDNVAAFGGDPGNVTIFGQSGGGGKVTHLMHMPSAKGLFHKVVAQSGGGAGYRDGDMAQIIKDQQAIAEETFANTPVLSSAMTAILTAC